jgi:hypothetical protein
VRCSVEIVLYFYDKENGKNGREPRYFILSSVAQNFGTDGKIWSLRNVILSQTLVRSGFPTARVV